MNALSSSNVNLVNICPMTFFITHCFLLSFSSFLYVDHPIHISRTEINVSSQEQEVQISAKLYIDDLELVIKNKTKKELKLFTPKELTEANQIIHQYIQDKLLIAIDGKKCIYQMVGKEASEDHLAVWVYLSSRANDKGKNMTIDSRYMYEIYNDQRNMVDISIDGKRLKSTILEQNEKPYVVSLSEKN
jgi:hypothetical protein